MPLRERLAWLELPWWRRDWLVTKAKWGPRWKAMVEWVHTRRAAYQMWRDVKKVERLEREDAAV